MTLAILLVAALSSGQSSATTYAFTNGQWFDGAAFRPRVVYGENGVFRDKKPAMIDVTIDLHGGYVMPPFGDAHHHNLDSAYNIDQQLAMYLEHGVFYAMTQANLASGAAAVASRVNNPQSVDVVYAQGCLTGTDSHPIPTYEALALGLYTPGQQKENAEKIKHSRLRENDVYYIIDNVDDLEKKWPMILSKHPGLIKIILLHSERYEERKKRTGVGEGIDPKLVPAIVSKVHAANLRVSAHVDSISDFRAALAAGVDIMAHIPGYYSGAGEDPAGYLIAKEEAVAAAKKHVVMIPTFSRDSGYLTPERMKEEQAIQIPNLRTLKDAGVTIAIGTDSYGTDSQFEALYLSKLGVFTNAELLKMWSIDTPRMIFPERKIGRFEDGYEASFVVIKDNPLTDFKAVREITTRFKQGQPITIPLPKSGN